MAAIEKLFFPSYQRKLLEPYLPDVNGPMPEGRPWVTLTYACSLDSQIAVAPGAQTVLSGPASKAMTHYLRTKHDAILVGSGTAITDDPGLNSRLSDAIDAGLTLQPTPVVLDRRGRWQLSEDSKVMRLAREGRGKGPIVFVDHAVEVPDELEEMLAEVDGAYTYYSSFENMLKFLYSTGHKSVMIEGGATIINAMLNEHAQLIDSIIVTYAPVFLGQGGVSVCPPKHEGRSTEPVARFEKVAWIPLDEDVVMCAKPKR